MTEKYLNSAGFTALRSLKQGFPAVVAPLLIAAFIVCFDNQAFWRTLGATYGGAAPWPVLLAVGAALTLLLTALLQLFNFRWTFKPVAMLLLFGAALASYFMDRFGVVIDVEMYRNVVQTDPREAGELMSGALYLHLLLHGVLPIVALIALPLRHAPLRTGWWRQPAVAAGCLLLAVLTVLTVYKDVSLTVRQHRELRMLLNPSYPLYSLVKYQRQQGGRRPAAANRGRRCAPRSSRAGRPAAIAGAGGGRNRARHAVLAEWLPARHQSRIAPVGRDQLSGRELLRHLDR